MTFEHFLLSFLSSGANAWKMGKLTLEITKVDVCVCEDSCLEEIFDAKQRKKSLAREKNSKSLVIVFASAFYRRLSRWLILIWLAIASTARNAILFFATAFIVDNKCLYLFQSSGISLHVDCGSDVGFNYIFLCVCICLFVSGSNARMSSAEWHRN